MSLFLLVIIYLTFISQGMQISLLGAAWPVMHADLGVPVSVVSIINAVVYTGTILLSLFVGKVVRRFGTGKVVLAGILVTALALLAYSFAPSFSVLLLLAFPLGCGGGTVEASINHFLPVHYKAQHLLWFNCSWDVGATIGPLVMAVFLANGNDWRGGYRMASFIQLGVVLMLLCTLFASLWQKVARKNGIDDGGISSVAVKQERKLGNWQVLKRPGVKVSLMALLCLGMIGGTSSLWSSTFWVTVKGFSVEAGARSASFFYIGEMLGLFLGGIFSLKVSSRLLMRTSQILCLAGGVLLLLPLPYYFAVAGLLLVGLGFGPNISLLIYSAKEIFGSAFAQLMVGLQVAAINAGRLLGAPVFSVISGVFGIACYPWTLCAYAAIILFCSEFLRYMSDKKDLRQAV